MKVAIVYDRVNKWGGAERVLLSLHQIFPDAPLYTSVYNQQTAGWAEEFDVRPSFLQNFPFAKNSHELYPLLMPIAFESFNFDEYDLVVSVSSEAAKGIITKPQTKHLAYLLTPTRYLWSGYYTYFSNLLFRLFASPVISYLRVWDKVASKRPDRVISISNEVQRRIKKYYGLDSTVVYPPVSLGLSFAATGKSSIPDKNYYLVVSRLVPYKKIQLAVEACTKLGKKLIVIGIGSELEYLRSIAGPTVKFIGKVSDEKLIQYYYNSKALIFPGIEDFGITMVESLAFGKPVIAFEAGGALEIIQNYKTGIFFPEQKCESLIEAIEEFETCKFKKKDLITQAEKFSENNFEQSFKLEIDKLFANS